MEVENQQQAESSKIQNTSSRSQEASASSYTTVNRGKTWLMVLVIELMGWWAGWRWEADWDAVVKMGHHWNTSIGLGDTGLALEDFPQIRCRIGFCFWWESVGEGEANAELALRGWPTSLLVAICPRRL
jgi:hypothetical protein